MRVLLVSAPDLNGELAFVLRAQEDGHKVKWAVTPSPKNELVGKGMVDRVPDYREWMRWADLVILADNTKYLREMDAWRERGTPMIGATAASSEWELNRTHGMQIFRKAGIGVVPYKEFSDYDDAIRFVKREMRRFVSKPCGDEPDKSLSYVSCSPEDMVYMLERWKKAQKLKGRFILQDFVPGTEMAVGGWVGPNGFIDGWCENFEFKKIMAGDLGVNCGEMGTVLRYVSTSKLARKVLKPLEDEIVATGHTGYVDVNCIIDDKGHPWPLEWTMRLGYPTINIQLALCKGDSIQWLADLADGRDSKPWRHNEVSVGVLMAMGDFPHSHITRKEVTGIPIYGITARNRDNLHFCQVMTGEAPIASNGSIIKANSILTAGDYVLVATGTGESVRLARDKAYRMIEGVTLPSSPFWRNDIGGRLRSQLPKVQAHGYATDLSY